MAARTQLAYRTLNGVGIIQGSPSYEPLPGFERPGGNVRCCIYSPCGRYLAWASPEKVTVVDASVGRVVTLLPAQNVFELGFSPFGTFIITWQRPSKNEKGDALENLKVWRETEGVPDAGGGEHNVVGRFVQKSSTGWNLQYTQDERLCARAVTNEVHFYQSGDLTTVWNKLRVEGVTEFAVSPSKHHAVAAFVPERKGLPAAVRVFSVSNFDAPISQKTFFKGDKVQLKWNKDGSSLIVLAQTEVDKSGKSYYGETTLYLMSADGSFDSRIHLDKDGPIYDVAWSPNSKEFGVVYGYMPAKATLFNSQVAPTHTFPLGPRNTILFSPYGNYIIIAGFGNLAGQMDIYDLEKDHTKICTIEASNASVCEWSPDSKHILTATTSPRLRVDNGLRIWHVRGGLMYNEDLEELYHVTWRPQLMTQHPLESSSDAMPAPHASAVKYLGTVKTPSKPAGAYRPPGARGQLTPLTFKREDEGGVAYVSNGSLSQGIKRSIFGKSTKREVPGAEVGTSNDVVPASAARGEDDSVSKAAAKNKKKRDAKKAKEASHKTIGLLPAAEGVGAERTTSQSRSLERKDANGHERPRSKGNAANKPKSQRRPQNPAHVEQQQVSSQTPRPPTKNDTAIQTVVADPPNVTVASAGSGGTPHDKKLRALLKKLRAIDDLKIRRAGGESLEGTQIKKMETEGAVRKELDDLGWNG